MEARFKMMSKEIIAKYKDEFITSDEINEFLKQEIKPFRTAKRLTGGRISGVYKYDEDGQEFVLKYSIGTYRMIELKREAEVLSYLNDTAYKDLVPTINQFRVLDNFSYLIQNYFDAKTVREKIKLALYSNEKQAIWKNVGEALSKLHGVFTSVDTNHEWLNSQLKLAKLNMEHHLIDLDDFNGELPEDVLSWLIINKPERTQINLLHGDFRTKNILMDQEYSTKVIDWGFVDIGDPYYDLAIIDYYFQDASDRDGFYEGYNKSTPYDKKLIVYYDRLSWFVNV